MVQATILPLTPTDNKGHPHRGLDQLILPLKKECLRHVHASIAAELNTSFQEATKGIPTLLAQCQATPSGNYTAANLTTLRESMPCKTEQVGDMANTLMHQLRQAQPILLRICPTKPPVSGHFFNRTTAKEYSKMIQNVKDIKNIRRLTCHLTDDTSIEEITATTQHLMNQQSWTKEATEALQNMPMGSTTLQQWRRKWGSRSRKPSPGWSISGKSSRKS